MDSGAFTELRRHGEHRRSVGEYASEVKKRTSCGVLLAAVAQDYMCEPSILDSTGATVRAHQYRTVERYAELEDADTGGAYIMPVIQGWKPEDYVRCVRMYGDLLSSGQWVGVGSVCKRESVSEIIDVLDAIHSVRPSLRLHGFGVKKSTLRHGVRQRLVSADSMAWSYRARAAGRDANDWTEATRYFSEIEAEA